MDGFTKFRTQIEEPITKNGIIKVECYGYLLRNVGTAHATLDGNWSFPPGDTFGTGLDGIRAYFCQGIRVKFEGEGMRRIEFVQNISQKITL
jgi:hypothetical protein